MNLRYLPTSVVVVWLLFATSIRAEENPMDDPDLQQLLKQAQEMQKSSGSPDARKKLAEMEAMAKEQAAQQEQEEKQEKEKLQAALKKLVDAQVKIVQTGTSSLTPEKIADSWQAAAAAANNLNQSLNKMNVNGKITRILFLSTRTDPRQEVELEASREPDSKITQIQISSPLPKPDIESE